MSRAATQGFDRQALIGDLALKVREFFKRALPWIGGLLAIGVLRMLQLGVPGVTSFVGMSIAMVAVLTVWRTRGVGLPLLPMFIVQQFLAYAVPLYGNNDTLKGYTESQLESAGLEVIVFFAAIGGAWTLGMQLFRGGKGFSYALKDFQRSGGKKLTKFGFVAAGGATVILVGQSTGLLDALMNMLPNGSASAVNALLGAASSCGFFLLGMLVGGRQIKRGAQAAVYFILFLNCFLSAASFILSSVIFVLISYTVGVFWTSGKAPWRFLIVVLCSLSFLNVGKYAMRDKYWKKGIDGQDGSPNFTLSQMPGTYTEWVEASIDGVANGEAKKKQVTAFGETEASDTTSLFGRVNNLQNLLYVVDAEQRLHIEPMGGDTYLIIPALLVPRVLWPNKPRTHEGQVMLNVHFGRQDLISTFSTYVAWGLLPEAYGNFGPLFGSIILGSVLGLGFAWMEKATSRKLVLSLEGFLAFTVFLGLANSVEMVASVLVPSIVQSIEPIVVAAMPFVTRVRSAPALAAAPPSAAPETEAVPPA